MTLERQEKQVHLCLQSEILPQTLSRVVANALPPLTPSFLWGLSASSGWFPSAGDWILEASALLREGGLLSSNSSSTYGFTYCSEQYQMLNNNAGSSRRRAVVACRVCRARKVKCSNERPSCAGCVRLGCQCVYPKPPTNGLQSYVTCLL